MPFAALIIQLMVALKAASSATFKFTQHVYISCFFRTQHHQLFFFSKEAFGTLLGPNQAKRQRLGILRTKLLPSLNMNPVMSALIIVATGSIAMGAPSSSNVQAWYCHVWTDPDKLVGAVNS